MTAMRTAKYVARVVAPTVGGGRAIGRTTWISQARNDIHRFFQLFNHSAPLLTLVVAGVVYSHVRTTRKVDEAYRDAVCIRESLRSDMKEDEAKRKKEEEMVREEQRRKEEEEESLTRGEGAEGKFDQL